MICLKKSCQELGATRQDTRAMSSAYPAAAALLYSRSSALQPAVVASCSSPAAARVDLGGQLLLPSPHS